MKSLNDLLYDIDRRPPNWELRLSIAVQTVIASALGGAAPLFGLHWLGVRQWPLVAITLLSAAAVAWWTLRYFKRRGVKIKAEYVAAGGNPAGTTDLLFGQVIGKTMPDGRWKWPEPSSGAE